MPRSHFIYFMSYFKENRPKKKISIKVKLCVWFFFVSSNNILLVYKKLGTFIVNFRFISFLNFFFIKSKPKPHPFSPMALSFSFFSHFFSHLEFTVQILSKSMTYSSGVWRFWVILCDIDPKKFVNQSKIIRVRYFFFMPRSTWAGMPYMNYYYENRSKLM